MPRRAETHPQGLPHVHSQSTLSSYVGTVEGKGSSVKGLREVQRSSPSPRTERRDEDLKRNCNVEHVGRDTSHSLVSVVSGTRHGGLSLRPGPRVNVERGEEEGNIDLLTFHSVTL